LLTAAIAVSSFPFGRILVWQQAGPYSAGCVAPKMQFTTHTITSRGFELIRFKDRDGRWCSLQQSSIADFEPPGSSAIWLGFEEENRMHMSRLDVIRLNDYLSRWILTGSFYKNKRTD